MNDAKPYGVKLTIGDDIYPVVWGNVSARHVGEMRLLFGYPPSVLAKAIDEDAMDLPEVAALAWLSERMTGKEPDPADFLDGITESSVIRIDGLDAPIPTIGEDADPEA